jgi:high-affinity Fe2+/Pb2+ permease
VGAWNVGLGVAAGHARLVDDPGSLAPVGVTGVLFGVLQGVALVRYGGELDGPPLSTAAYVLALVAITAVGVWLLRAARRAGRPGGRPTLP